MNYQRVYDKWVSQGSPVDNNGSVLHNIKMYYLWRTFQQTGYRVFVESGTCQGDAVKAMLPYVDEIHTYEAYEPFFKHCVERFASNYKVNLYCGDSGLLLPELILELDEPAVFWLDAHYSGEGTALLDKETPIVAELEAISKSNLPHAIIIDDARGFGVWNDYPSIEWMRLYCSQLFPNHTFYLEGDEIFVMP